MFDDIFFFMRVNLEILVLEQTLFYGHFRFTAIPAHARTQCSTRSLRRHLRPRTMLYCKKKKSSARRKNRSSSRHRRFFPPLRDVLFRRRFFFFFLNFARTAKPRRRRRRVPVWRPSPFTGRYLHVCRAPLCIYTI